MVDDILDAERQYLSRLLEAIQRCVYFFHASDSKISWPLEGHALTARKKDEELFESLSAINERFAKLQDTPTKPSTPNLRTISIPCMTFSQCSTRHLVACSQAALPTSRSILPVRISNRSFPASWAIHQHDLTLWDET